MDSYSRVLFNSNALDIHPHYATEVFRYDIVQICRNRPHLATLCVPLTVWHFCIL